jgi:uncharacterized protein (DUF1684 family)
VKTKNIILITVVAVIVTSIIYMFMGSRDQASYNAQIEKERDERDRFMKTSPDSPFASDPTNYKGLNYFPPDIRYKVTATLTPVKVSQPVVLSTSDGKEQQYLPYAYATFDLDGFSNQLLILENMQSGPERGSLFLPFGDGTSAGETYGAGRYLDVAKVPGNNAVTLDFNKAYNPYCAYDAGFSCPFPPAENLLRPSIRAGEKSYH